MPHSPNRLSASILAFLLCTAACPALWMSPSWRLTADSSASFGYDSNINETHNATEDYILGGDQNFLLRRRGGRTHLSLGTEISETHFLLGHARDSLDGKIVASFAYPADDTLSGLLASGKRTADTYIAPPEDTQLSRTILRAAWSSATTANSDLGERVKSNALDFNAANAWFVAPKLLWSTDLRLAHTDFAKRELLDHDDANLRTSILHDWRPDARWGGEYELQLGRTDPTVAGAVRSKMVVQTLSLTADGILLPKVYGRASAGVSVADYSQTVTGPDISPRFGCGLTWERSPLAQLHLDGGYEFSFLGIGVPERRISLTLSEVRQIAKGVTLTASLSPAYSIARFTDHQRHDKELRAGLVGSYQFTEKFDLSLSTRWAHIDSDEVARSFIRTEIFANVSFHY